MSIGTDVFSKYHDVAIDIIQRWNGWKLIYEDYKFPAGESRFDNLQICTNIHETWVCTRGAVLFQDVEH